MFADFQARSSLVQMSYNRIFFFYIEIILVVLGACGTLREMVSGHARLHSVVLIDIICIT